MKDLDNLIKQARSLSTRSETDYRLTQVYMLYQPNQPLCSIRLSLYGRDTGTIRETLPIIMRKDQTGVFIERIAPMLFPTLPDKRITIISMPLRKGEALPTEGVLDITKWIPLLLHIKEAEE